MGLRKIADLPKLACRHPEHAPPTMISLAPGVYEHTCPGCGASTVFAVTQPMMSVGPTGTASSCQVNSDLSRECGWPRPCWRHEYAAYLAAQPKTTSGAGCSCTTMYHERC